MSQAGQAGSSGSSPGGSITLDGDVGSAVSVLGVINVVGGTGIQTLGAGDTLTISQTGTGVPWTDVTGGGSPLSENNNYLANNAGLVTFTLPATAVQFSTITIKGYGAGGFYISQNANQQIIFGNIATTVGLPGYILSTDANDGIELLCVVGGASTVWTVLSSVGNLLVV